jgi:hypothetical protein
MKMIKLMCNFLDKPINIENMTILTIENATSFSKIASELYYYSEDIKSLKIFKLNQENLKTSEVLTIFDILGFNINSTSFLKTVYSELENQIKDNVENRSKYEKLFYELEDLLREEMVDVDLPLELSSLQFQSLFKAMGIKIIVEEENIYKKILDIVESMAHFRKSKLICFVNTLAYITAKEIKELKEYISLSQLDVLFLEPRKVEGFRQALVDEDFVFFENMV